MSDLTWSTRTPQTIALYISQMKHLEVLLKPALAAQALLLLQQALLVLVLNPLLCSHTMNQAGRRMQIVLQPVSHTDAQMALLACCRFSTRMKSWDTAALPSNLKPQTENKADITYQAGTALADKIQKKHVYDFLVYYRL